MKHILIAATLVLASSTVLATDVGVSISIGDPGFYGQINIGNAPRPRLVYPEPVVIYRQAQPQGPLYLRVPPGHAKDWKKHCKHYNACYRPVYFVQDDWYQEVYTPYYQEQHGKSKDKGGKGNNGNNGNNGNKSNNGNNGKGKKDKD